MTRWPDPQAACLPCLCSDEGHDTSGPVAPKWPRGSILCISSPAERHGPRCCPTERDRLVPRHIALGYGQSPSQVADDVYPPDSLASVQRGAASRCEDTESSGNREWASGLPGRPAPLRLRIAGCGNAWVAPDRGGANQQFMSSGEPETETSPSSFAASQKMCKRLVRRQEPGTI